MWAVDFCNDFIFHFLCQYLAFKTRDLHFLSESRIGFAAVSLDTRQVMVTAVQLVVVFQLGCSAEPSHPVLDSGRPGFSNLSSGASSQSSQQHWPAGGRAAIL